MAAAVTYPGVYVAESSSGVRTIAGVSTSVAAFIGWTAKGPTDRAELVLNWTDYVLEYGGLDRRSVMSYAVYHFFLNGGEQAWIIRLVSAAPPPCTPEAGNCNGVRDNNEAKDAKGAAAAKAATEASLSFGPLAIKARNPGEWGNSYAIHIEHLPKLPGVESQSRFNLSVLDWKHDPEGAGIPVEIFHNLAMDPDKDGFVGTALEAGSRIITATQAAASSDLPPQDLPPQSDWKLTDKVPDGAKLKEGDDGTPLAPTDTDFQQAVLPTVPAGGVYHLDRVDIFNLLCVPGMTDATTLSNLQTFCKQRRALLIADCAKDATVASLQGGPAYGLTGAAAANAAFYFPWVRAPDPLQEDRPAEFPPCGFIAGLYARTDSNRGVWKAPAGTDASLVGVLGVTQTLNNGEIGLLNPQAINCIRTFPVHGTVAWGARTLHGDDARISEWKYVPVRRTALFIEESTYRGLRWVIFEPNDEALWSQVRLNVGTFMNTLFRNSAFQGSTPQEAYFVKCDSHTTTQIDIDRGLMNIMIGFAPLKPAEFVILQLRHIAGRSQPEENRME